MDLQTLSNLFATTYNPDPNVRKAAELQVRKIGAEEGLISALLQIIASDNVDLATRQACSVYIKNRVQTSSLSAEVTNPRPDQMPIPASDQTALRACVLRLLATSPSRSITVQLAGTLRQLVSNEFPEKWPGLLGEIRALLASGNVNEVHAGCVAALECVRAFRSLRSYLNDLLDADDERRFRQKSETLPKIIEELFPSLVQIGSQMISTALSSAQEFPTMLHLIVKTYKTSIIINLAHHLQQEESLIPWGGLFFGIVNLNLPKEAVPEDEDERERSEWWKAKKWAYGTLGRLFHRYGNPSQLPSTMKDEYGVFAERFVSSVAPEIFKTYLNQVKLFVQNEAWLSKKSQYYIFSYFTECVKPKTTWALLKPHYETLVQRFVFPQLSFSQSKKEQWENDSVDYIRLSLDEYENYDTPVSAATTFLLSLITNRTKATFLPILGLVNQVLQSNAPPDLQFGALNVTATLGPWIMRHPEVKGGMETFLMQHVVKEYTSGEPYLRAIACEVLGTVEKNGLVWSNDENLNVHFRAVANCLDDPELPVRVQAALALTELVTNHESVKAVVSPNVGKIIQDLLKMSDETDLDLLNRSMEVMVQQFQTELLPVAVQLTSRLCESYLRLAKDGMAQDESEGISDMSADVEDSKVFAAMGIAKTIGTIVSSVESSPEILREVQEVIIPIVIFTLEHKSLDLYDNMYDLVDSLTFKSREISPNMWPVFELTYKLFKSDAVDFLEEMLPSLDNFVSYGTEVFKARADYRQMVLDIYLVAMTSEQLGESDRINGCKLAESLLLNVRDRADDTLQPIIAMGLENLDKGHTSALRLANLEVLINAVLYNPQASLHIMETTRPGAARAFFDKWFAAINGENKLPRVHDKKLSIMALCALLEMEPSGIPETVRDGWPGIMVGALKVFKELPKAVADRKQLEEDVQEEEEEEDDYDDVKILNLVDEEGDVWDEDSAYLELLAKESALLKEKHGRQSGDNEEEEEEEEDDESSGVEEELGYFSPLDKAEPYSAFKNSLAVFQMQNAGAYQAATTSLGIEEQTLLMEVMQLAETQGVPPAQV